MVDRDLIVRSLTIKDDATFNFNDLYKIIKNWFSHHKYDLLEGESQSKEKTQGGSDLGYKIGSEKRLDDYNKAHIDLTISLTDYQEIIIKNRKYCKAFLVIKFKSYIDRDISDAWSENPLKKFLRSCYDHFIIGDRLSKFNNEIHDETYELYNEIKAFLALNVVD